MGHLSRLVKDLQYLDLRRCGFAVRTTDESGRLVGGWLKAGRADPAAEPA